MSSKENAITALLSAGELLRTSAKYWREDGDEEKAEACEELAEALPEFWEEYEEDEEQQDDERTGNGGSGEVSTVASERPEGDEGASDPVGSTEANTQQRTKALRSIEECVKAFEENMPHEETWTRALAYVFEHTLTALSLINDSLNKREGSE